MGKFRYGVVVGAALGYYLGAQAGRRRYEQLNRLARAIASRTPLASKVDKAKAVVDLTKERARVDLTAPADIAAAP